MIIYLKTQKKLFNDTNRKVKTLLNVTFYPF